MFCMAAQSMGYRVAVLDPGDASPAGSVADRHIRADYGDREGLAALAGLVAAATTEFENVPAASLEYLGARARVTPAAASVAVAQDRIREKQFLSQHGFAVAPFKVLASEDDAGAIDPKLLPGIVKRARLGYDGKGQIGVDTAAAVAPAS
ncbi:MAG TPA: 5-(carboxyamino)imidazole ribonucleotide synthase, partial [Casimicrobiaceae bacterium]|nr:5-(carboxyamino)imidazole ribonucleotide synthase [Casimicrobiaceae bacterium]